MMDRNDFAFTVDFKSESFPAMNGPVSIRYATTMDVSAIEGLMGPAAGFVGEAIACLHVLITDAPASWYRIPRKGGAPVLDLGRLPEVEGVLDLFLAYSRWRAAA